MYVLFVLFFFPLFHLFSPFYACTRRAFFFFRLYLCQYIYGCGVNLHAYEHRVNVVDYETDPLYNWTMCIGTQQQQQCTSLYQYNCMYSYVRLYANETDLNEMCVLFLLSLLLFSHTTTKTTTISVFGPAWRATRTNYHIHLYKHWINESMYTLWTIPSNTCSAIVLRFSTLTCSTNSNIQLNAKNNNHLNV